MKQNDNIQKFEAVGKARSLDPEIENEEMKRL